MSYTEETLLVTTVGDDRTIVLPDSVPSGSTVGIFVLTNGGKRKLNRKERFKAALAEIEAAVTRSQREPITLRRYRADRVTGVSFDLSRP